MKTNFDKVKEEMRIEDLQPLKNPFCSAARRVRKDINCCVINCEECRKWLAQEYKEPILDDVEKEYLSAVIKPFKNRVKYIVKKHDSSKEFIFISLDDDYIFFPYFEKGTMYKGMKSCKEYTLKELGLE